MKILVTGSQGFLGKYLCRRLWDEGHTVVQFDISISKYNDITNIDYIRGHVEWATVDYVFHLAAMADVTVTKDYPDETFEVNVKGTYNLAYLCSVWDIPLCYTSTCCVYGNTIEHPSRENSELRPTEIYAKTKLWGEYIVKHMVPRWNILRLGTMIGINMRSTLAVDIFLEQAIKKQPFTVHGDGKQTRSWIDVDDVVDGMIRVMNGKMKNKIFNIANSTSYSVNEVMYICSSITGSLVEKVYKPERENDFKYEEISIDKAQALLGWRPKKSVYDSIMNVYLHKTREKHS